MTKVNLVNVLKFLMLLNKILDFRAGIHKMLGMTQVPDQTDLGLHCLCMYFWQTTSVRNFRTFTILMYYTCNNFLSLPLYRGKVSD